MIYHRMQEEFFEFVGAGLSELFHYSFKPINAFYKMLQPCSNFLAATPSTTF